MSSAQPTVSSRVGVVGAGQLARMMGEVASVAGVTLTALASAPEDAAAATCDSTLIGAPDDLEQLRRLANLVDVITFDHELVDLGVLETLERDGLVLRPSSAALHFAVDKAYQRRAFRDAGIPVPSFVVVRSSSDEHLSSFLSSLHGPAVVKRARGGYDGRGVVFPASNDEVPRLVDEFKEFGEVVVEERLSLRGEVAQLVARSVDGALVFYPVVATLQRDGMCVEVRYPSDLDATSQERAQQLSDVVATLVQGVGIMAIEYFVTDGGLVVNEVALRPHNTGHWTIEGAATSQFVQHLRAVSGQSLGATTPLAPNAVMVNVVGASTPGSLSAAREVSGVYVHDYGKSWRPMRKLGHVTALGDEPTSPHVRAWNSARAYGTSSQET